MLTNLYSFFSPRSQCSLKITFCVVFPPRLHTNLIIWNLSRFSFLLLSTWLGATNLPFMNCFNRVVTQFVQSSLCLLPSLSCFRLSAQCTPAVLTFVFTKFVIFLSNRRLKGANENVGPSPSKSSDLEGQGSGHLCIYFQNSQDRGGKIWNTVVMKHDTTMLNIPIYFRERQRSSRRNEIENTRKR